MWGITMKLRGAPPGATVRNEGAYWRVPLERLVSVVIGRTRKSPESHPKTFITNHMLSRSDLRGHRCQKKGTDAKRSHDGECQKNRMVIDSQANCTRTDTASVTVGNNSAT